MKQRGWGDDLHDGIDLIRLPFLMAATGVFLTLLLLAWLYSDQERDWR